MAVAHFKQGEVSVERNFHPPKTATLKAWYKSASKAFGDAVLPMWVDGFAGEADVSSETIIFGQSCRDGWTLMIARKAWSR